ncbi:unnamed protein product, partial [marine sediment metagenome]
RYTNRRLHSAIGYIATQPHMSGRYIRFRAKKFEKVEYLTENAGVFLPLSRKSLDVETKWCQEFIEEY